MKSKGYLTDNSNNKLYIEPNGEWISMKSYLPSSIEDWGDGYRTSRFRKDNTKVTLEGTIRAKTAGNTLVTLPVGFRPQQTNNLLCLVSIGNVPTLGKCAIETSGRVFLQDRNLPVGDWVSLNGIEFFTD